MLLTIEDMVKLLRDSVNIQNSKLPVLDENGEPTLDEDGNIIYGVVDSAYLDMTDEDIQLYIKLGCSRSNPTISDLSEIEEGMQYPIILLSKIELYRKLAVIKADKIDLVADNNNQLKQSQRFDHYMKLAEDAKQEYEFWLENEDASSNTVESYNVLLGKRHYSHRNYELQQTPKVKVSIANITSDSADVAWSVSNVSKFGCYKVFFSTKPIVDLYKEGALALDKVNEGAKLVKNTYNIRNNTYKLKGLEAETQYYLAVFCIERNQVFGVKEISFTTLEEFKEEEEIEIPSVDETPTDTPNESEEEVNG